MANERPCAKCGTLFEPAPSATKPRSRCDRCTRSPVAREEPRGQQPAYKVFEKERRHHKKKLDDPDNSDLLKARRIAWGLDDFDDPETAAIAAGVFERGEDLDRIVALARKHFSALIARETTALSALVTGAIHRVTCRMLDDADLMPPSQAANSIARLAQAREVLSGKGNAVDYAEITVAINGPEGESNATESDAHGRTEIARVADGSDSKT